MTAAHYDRLLLAAIEPVEVQYFAAFKSRKPGLQFGDAWSPNGRAKALEQIRYEHTQHLPVTVWCHPIGAN